MRIAFRMAVKKGDEVEYEKRHNPIWPELQELLLEHGVTSYSIFLDEATATLFAYAEIESEELWQKIAQTETCRKWWEYMAPIMPSNPDNSPKSLELREVFHMEGKS